MRSVVRTSLFNVFLYFLIFLILILALFSFIFFLIIILILILFIHLCIFRHRINKAYVNNPTVENKNRESTHDKIK